MNKLHKEVWWICLQFIHLCCGDQECACGEHNNESETIELSWCA